MARTYEFRGGILGQPPRSDPKSPGLTPRAHDPKSPYFTRITGISQKGFTILLWPVNEFV